MVSGTQISRTIVFLGRIIQPTFTSQRGAPHCKNWSFKVKGKLENQAVWGPQTKSWLNPSNYINISYSYTDEPNTNLGQFNQLSDAGVPPCDEVVFHIVCIYIYRWYIQYDLTYKL